MVSLSIKLAGKLLNCSRFRTAICVQQLRSAKQYSTVQIKEDLEIDEFLNDKEYLHLKSEFIKPLPHDQRVLVVQPFIRKTAAEKSPDLMLGMVLLNCFYEFQSISHCTKFHTSSSVCQWISICSKFHQFYSSCSIDFPTDETVALAESIPNWRVVHKMKKGLNSLSRYNVFGSKQLEDIADEAGKYHANNVVIGLDWLNGAYQMKIEKELRRDVYDRYSMILRIFHSRATTKEAKIQTQLAEIPYIRARLNLFSRNPEHHQAGMAQTIGTGGKDYYNRRKLLLDKRAKDLKQKLVKIENARYIISPQRKSVKVPVVGIVGYTNCGKTSLIKYFTKNNESIKPMDQLFATLDLSRFMIRLNNNQDVFLLDTIGFISNIPKNLLDAFHTTLKEICDCDLIIHIYDANHPDLENQKRTVYETLFEQIKVDEKLQSTMIEVGNKIDLIDQDTFKEFSDKHPEHLFISVTEKINLPLLAERKCILKESLL